ncbi:Uncharacterised protein [Mycobacteroides abscessus subsp. abscessus]|nr:Uncharacterised protein [Mycobacteroides abscessus subsp. abscessus]
MNGDCSAASCSARDPSRMASDNDSGTVEELTFMWRTS